MFKLPNEAMTVISEVDGFKTTPMRHCSKSKQRPDTALDQDLPPFCLFWRGGYSGGRRDSLEFYGSSFSRFG